MKFADELRNGLGKGQSAPNTVQIEHQTAEICRLLKERCVQANKAGVRSISVYWHSEYDEGYSENSLIDRLPTVEDAQARAAKFNSERHRHLGHFNDPGVGVFEEQLYKGCVLTTDREHIALLARRVREEVAKLGFTQYGVTPIELSDVRVIRERKTGLLSSRVTERVTTRTEPQKLYNLRITVQW